MLDFKEYIDALIAEYGNKCLQGHDYVPIIQDAMQRLNELWNDDRAEVLGTFDFDADQRAAKNWFQELFQKKSGPPPEANTLILWFVGSGPNYPLSVTAYPEEISYTDDYVDTEIFSDYIWESEEESFYYPPFTSKANEVLLQRPAASREEPFALNHLEVAIIGFYARLLVSWIAVVFRDDWLRHRDKLGVVYGVSGNDDGHIAGRLSRAHGWQPIGELIGR